MREKCPKKLKFKIYPKNYKMFLFKGKARWKFQQSINGIKGFKASNAPKKVVLVNKQFHDDLIIWLSNLTAKPPTNLNTEIFFSENDIKSNLKRGVDYEIISYHLWNDIVTQFGSHPKIEGILIKDPKKGEETLLFLHHPSCLEFNIYLPKKVANTDSYSISLKPIQYYSHPNWVLDDVKKQICRNYNLNISQFSITQHSSKTNPILRINGNFTMKQVYSIYKNDLDLRQNKLIQTDIIPNRMSLRFHRNPSDSKSSTQPSKTAQPPTTSKTSEKNQNKKLNAFSSSPEGNFLFPQPVGFHNLGNTCYFNASVQCLIRVIPLTTVILSPTFSEQLNPSNVKSSGGQIANAYRHFLEGLCRGPPSQARDPSQLRNAVVSKFRAFANFAQHDSQEFLCSLLDGLHEDMNQSPKVGGRSKPIQITNDSDGWDLHLSGNRSPIVDIFHGILCNSITCPSCGFIEKVREPFEFLSIEVPRKFGSVKLESCLEKFSRKESLGLFNRWKCEKCNKMVCPTKENGIVRCGGKALIIHLKRFSGDGIFSLKIDTNVDYPDVLHASSFTKEDQGVFELIGAVFHFGGMGGGHYTAAAVDPCSNEWFYFNDSTARRIDRSEAHSRSAYILFYQRIE